ncbi:CHAT domain-containing protein [Geodermatophilus sp. SYSU D00779]
MDVRDEGQELLALADLQTQAMSAFMAALSAAHADQDAAYEHYFDLARRWLAGTEEFTARWGGPLDPGTVAQTLVQQLNIRADYAEADGDAARARARREEADALTARYLGPVATAYVRRGQVGRLAAQGRFNEALTVLYEVRATLTNAGEALGAMQCVLELANLYEWLCDFERALAALASVREESRPLLAEGPPTALDVLLAVGRQLESIAAGMPDRRGEDLLALRRIAYELVQTEGRIRRRLGEHDRARQLLLHVRDFAAEMGITAAIDFHLAVIDIAQGRLADAEGTLQRIEPELRGLLAPRRPALQLARADLELARREARAGLGATEEGLRGLLTNPDDDLAWKLQQRRGRALAALDQPDDALRAYLDGAGAADRLRRAPLGYRLDSTFVRDKREMFDEAIDLAARRGDAGAAARLIELVKARALSAVLSIPVDRRRPRSPDERRFHTVTARLDALEYAQYSGQGSAAATAERKALLAEREQLLERIRIADPRWRAMSEPAQVNLADTLRLLAEGDRAALTLFFRPGGVVSVLLAGGSARVGCREVDAGTQAALAAYVENLRRWKPEPEAFDASAEFGLTLESLVPADLAEAALAARTLLVVPHGPLHVLPWSGLTAAGRRLVEHTTVGVLPNLSCLALLDGPFPTTPRAALLGAPDYRDIEGRYPQLPGGEAHVEELAAVYGMNLLAPPVIGPALTEAAFQELARRPDGGDAVLHVTCHGSLEAQVPLSSGLLLTGAKVDAGEVAQERLAYPEVFLCACSAGWRPQRVGSLDLAGDDALGLTASFLEAGARFVLVSIPKAAVTATFAYARRWHELRRGGHSPLHAARTTLLEMVGSDPQQAWSWVGMTPYGCR